MIYKFIDDKGTFTVDNPHHISYLYFPLTNKNGSILSSISPNLAGDIKKDNDSFLTPPASLEDLKNNLLCRRDFFIKTKKQPQRVLRVSDPLNDRLEAGLLYHKLVKQNKTLHIEIINFIPFDLDVEVMWIKVKNKSATPYEFIPTSFVPLYGRGEKRLRDHRHVSSLLNRIEMNKFGIRLTPTMIFDERRHTLNHSHYFVLGYQNNRIPPQGQFPTLLDFTGEGGSLLTPQAIYREVTPLKKYNQWHQGKEACAAFRFPDITLQPGKEVNYILIMGISEDKNRIPRIFKKLDSPFKVRQALTRTKQFWSTYLSSLQFDFKNPHFNNWLKWVCFQPTLRKLFGCSFLPHFDYGKGGRGFRDLWQDLLALTLKDEPHLDKLFINNFGSIRIDGTNATIITKEGKCISDRNKIARVWCDHGVWPLLSTALYIKKTSQDNLLFKQIPYFSDHLRMRARQINQTFSHNDYVLRTTRNTIYRGTILEHLLIENVVSFFNVGRHNVLKLENGDWNDGLDMAPDKGESIPFYCMYGYNLLSLCEILNKVRARHKTIALLEESVILFDHLHRKINYDHWKEKRKVLDRYLEKTKYRVSGKKVKVDIDALIIDLTKKAQWIMKHIREKEWLEEGFFNGYYDNKGERVEGKDRRGLRLMLQSQVFPILSGAASPPQVKKIWTSLTRHLKDPKHKGYRLNTNFKNTYLDLGRAFAFSYGDKENGAFFNHMVVLLAYALYTRNFIAEGTEVLESIWNMATSPHAKNYPMIPEYFNSQGRGLYAYLTGSASWYVYTLFSEVLGIRYSWNKLIIEPKLRQPFFFKNFITVQFTHLRRHYRIVYEKLPRTKHYHIQKAYIGRRMIKTDKKKIVIDTTPRPAHAKKRESTIRIILG